MTCSKKIMLVDDNRDIQDLFKQILETEGHIVSGQNKCDSLEQLLAAVNGFHPDLIFVDHSMPNFTGADAIKILRSAPGTHAIPIIYFSGYDEIALLSEQAGADGFLKKPFELFELLKIIDNFASAPAHPDINP